MQYLDSVINGDTPIYQLVDGDDDIHLPVPEIVKAMAEYPKDENDSWDILVPKTLHSGARGIHLMEHVSGFPSGAEKCIVNATGRSISELAKKHGREINFAESGVGFGSVRYGGKATVTVCCARESERHPIDILSKDGRKRAYKWHPHLNTAVIIEKS